MALDYDRDGNAVSISRRQALIANPANEFLESLLGGMAAEPVHAEAPSIVDRVPEEMQVLVATTGS